MVVSDSQCFYFGNRYDFGLRQDWRFFLKNAPVVSQENPKKFQFVFIIFIIQISVPAKRL